MDLGNRHTGKRNLAAFWLLGLCNNYSYVIMLSAAHDILSDKEDNATISENRTGKLVPECNKVGTGAVLLADILPALIVKSTAPFYMHNIPYNIRVSVVLILAAASLIVVAFSKAMWLSLFGVVLASVSSGLGEITFLSMSSHFHRNVVSTWSSGTGAAGVFGALSYAGLTAIGVSPRNTVLIMLTIVLLMTLSYYCVLVRPENIRDWSSTRGASEGRQLLYDSDTEQEDVSSGSAAQRQNSMESSQESSSRIFTEASISCAQKLALILPLLKYMIPLGLVYFAEYFINQGIVELIYYEHIWLPIVQQYRWYQVIYQMGVFISRSSVNLVRIKYTWILTVLQFCNVAVLMCQVFLNYIPNIWIAFVIILFEGLLGGSAYVNTFYSVTEEVPIQHREYSLGIASVADSFGIAISGLVAIPVHNWICTL